MKIGKTYIEFISEKKSKKKSPAAQIKKLTKKQKTLIDKSKDIKDSQYLLCTGLFEEQAEDLNYFKDLLKEVYFNCPFDCRIQ